jgi:formamidopyrimidine-DNA glycosylase
VRAVERHGKFLAWRFDDGAALLLHLGMSGRVTVGVDPSVPWPPHTHLVVALDDGQEVRLRDPRRFGRIVWLEAGRPLHGGLGPDALARGFTRKVLEAGIAGRQAPIKSLLLNQTVVAGVGNIYADEALFLARIHPARAGGSLSPVEVGRLHRAVRRVLRAALAHRGTTFLSFADAAGREGGYLPHLRVYGRSGQRCRRCPETLASVVIGGRTSAFCPRCQAPPAPAEGPRPQHG